MTKATRQCVRGVIRGGCIVLIDPVDFPEGTEVQVEVDTKTRSARAEEIWQQILADLPLHQEVQKPARKSRRRK